MAYPRTFIVIGSLSFVCVGQNVSVQTANALDTGMNALNASGRTISKVVDNPSLTSLILPAASAGDALWRSLRPAPSNSSSPMYFSVASTWQERARRWHVVQGWAENWVMTCWRGLSALILLKAACMLSNMVFQMSPFPLINTIMKKQDTGDVDAAPLICIAFGCCQWTFYGSFAWWVTGKGGFLVLVYANVMGAVLGVVYVMLYHLHCKSEEWWRQLVLYYRIAVSIVLLQVVILFMRPREQALFAVGAIASTCSLLSAVSPLGCLLRVVQTQCSKPIPLPLVLASSVSAILWAACGIQLNDPMITWPNIIAIGANTILLGFASYYPQEEKLPFKDVCFEKELLLKNYKEGRNATFNTFSKDAKLVLCTDGWIQERESIADSSGGTF